MLKFNRRKTTKYAAVAGLLVFLYILGVLRPVEDIVSRMLNPALGSAQKLSHYISQKYNEQFSKVNLQERIEDLQNQVREFAQDKASLEKLAEENQLLREHLGFQEKNKLNIILANVVARGEETNITDTTQTIIINRGKTDGLLPGLAVVSSQGLLVGKIAEVHEGNAKVYLTNNPRCRLAVSAQNSNRTNGVAEGELGLTIKMGYIPQSEQIDRGDIVVTSGLEEHIPRGLVVGRVIEVNKESNELWQSAVIEPLVNPNDLIIVSVILP